MSDTDPDDEDGNEIVIAGTVAATLTARLIQHALTHGAPLPVLLERAGWRSAATPHPDERVPVATHFAVWAEIHALQLADDFGLCFGESFELDHLGVLGMLMTHAATLEQAMATQARFGRLLIDTPFKVSRLETQTLLIEHPRLPLAEQLPHMVVAGLAFWVKLLRLLLGEHVTARRVELPHAPLTSHERYHATFGVVPRFDAPRILLEFDRTWWTAPLRATRLGVESYLREHATTLLRGLATRDDDPLDGIREYMADELRHGRTPSLATIAKRMGSSSRSLQRSLQAAGHTHAELLDDTRRRLALEYLGDARLTLGEVAVVVGYSEPATFYRAFKRWTGVTPGAWRAQRASAQ